jgi:thioredoxin reductase/bacterioferritin-associated ferredoxin
MRTTEIAVIGAGPAGIGAALAAARNGSNVVVIDENLAPGGHLRWTMARQTGFGPPLDGLRGDEIAFWAAGELRASGVEVLTSSVAWGLFDDSTVGVHTPDASFQLQAAHVIIATGATDLTWPFPGWELPGVLTATASLRMMHLDRVLPGQRVAVLGSGADADAVAADLAACGADLVHRQPGVDGVTVGGSGLVEWIEVDGARSGCDAVVLALGRQPDAQLAHQAQVASTYAADNGVFVVVRDESLASSVPNIFVAGDAAGVGSPARAFAEGSVAGEAASGGVGLSGALQRLREVEQHPESLPLMPRIADDTLVCRCEEVRAGALRAAIADGAVSINDLKRRTRSGMGICQGVYCHRTMSGMIAAEAGIAVDAILPMTARPPARLIPMAALADLEP